MKNDVHLFFTITTDCQIVRSRSLPQGINYILMCLSAYRLQASRFPLKKVKASRPLQEKYFRFRAIV